MSNDLQVPSEASAGHRAHVTLMFSDLCGYTTLSEAIDPEELAEIRNRLDELASSIVHRHGGQVAQVYGDGQLCLFGFPQPTEDDVRHSIDAALELHAAVASAVWPTLPAGFELRLHTGVHGGLVFIRDGTAVHGRFHLSGDPVNTTARLCGEAKRDEILVSAATLGGDEQFFRAELVAPIWMRGKSASQSAYRIAGRSNVRSRFEARTRRGLTPFVNRHTEREAVMRNLGAAATGRGRIIVVLGAAGIGKTRLLEEFCVRAHTRGARVLRGTCENYGELVPLEPFSQMLHQVFADWAGIPRDTFGTEVVEQYGTYASLMALRTVRGLELASALVVPALQVLIVALTAQKPLALILDDWQWADDASRALLGQLREVALTHGVCVVVGMRGSNSVDPTLLQADEVLHLDPLKESDCVEFISSLRPDVIRVDVGEIVLQRAGGNPLFIEELCRALPRLRLDEHQPLAHSDVPTTVQGVIQTRIAGLSKADRQILRLAAVIGIEFRARMLAALDGQSELDVHTRLRSLIAEDLIYYRDVPATYHFKHGLTREVVYESVLLAERRQLHSRVAELLERTATPASESMQTAEALAYHYRSSGDLARAAQYAELAGDHAMAVSALDRACHHYIAAMAALDGSTPSPEIRRKWLTISAKWGLPFVFSPVRASQELSVLHTAIAYASELGDAEAKARSQHWLGWALYGLGRYSESIQHLEAALQLTRARGDLRFATQLQAAIGQSQAAAGDYRAGLENLLSAIAAKRLQAREKTSRRGRVAAGFAYALGSVALVHADRGHFTEADAEFAEALESVHGLQHAIEGSVLALKCIAQLWRGHWDEARATSVRAQQNALLVNSAFNYVTCSFYGAYAAWELTHAPEHVERMRLSIEWIAAHHLELYASADYAWFAHVLQSRGELEPAREYAERALQRAADGDPMGETMAYRVLARLSAPVDVDDHLARAVDAGARRGSQHEAVKSQLLQAEICQERHDLEGARSWAHASLIAARELGMTWHARRADQLLTAL